MAGIDEMDGLISEFLSTAFLSDHLAFLTAKRGGISDAVDLLWAVVRFRVDDEVTSFDQSVMACLAVLVQLPAAAHPPGFALTMARVARRLVVLRPPLWHALRDAGVVGWLVSHSDGEIAAVVLMTFAVAGRAVPFEIGRAHV
jgi:hypothetical protein